MIHCWPLLTIVDHCWPLLTTVDYCWLLLTIVDYCWLLLAMLTSMILFDVRTCFDFALTCVDSWWLVLTLASLCWLPLTHIDSCWLVVAIVDYRWLMLTIVDHRWLSLTAAVYHSNTFARVDLIWFLWVIPSRLCELRLDYQRGREGSRNTIVLHAKRFMAFSRIFPSLHCKIYKLSCLFCSSISIFFVLFSYLLSFRSWYLTKGPQ